MAVLLLYNQAVRHNLADMETWAVESPAVDLLDNWNVVVDILTLDNHTEVDMQQVDMLLVWHNQLVEVAVVLQNQAVEAHHSWTEWEMFRLEVQLHMGEGQTQWDILDT